jgi:hypothetical protein
MRKNIVERIRQDLKYSSDKMLKLRSQIKDDFEFSQGKQWDDSDVEELRKAGVKALTINKIKPIIRLLTGIERQSKSDFKAFPEGDEDAITAEIVTKLIKNVVKNSMLEVKLSDQFKNGTIGGLCFLEPYIDYSFDIINGDMKFKKVSPLDVYFDPNFKEYDLSDAKYIIKITADLSKDDLLLLFPDDEKKIDKIENGKIDFLDADSSEPHVQGRDYPALSDGRNVFDNERNGKCYDLIDYYYRDVSNRYFVIIEEQGVIEEFEKQDDAVGFNEKFGGVIIERKVPVIMHAQVVGETEMYHDVVWCYPRWRNLPLIPFFAELTTEDIGDLSLTIQGIVRGIRDLNLEYNKRRTQELRHLNSSANSGFQYEEGQLSIEEEEKLKKFGSSPGITIKRRQGSAPLDRITPMPLSQGHAQLAAENAQDLKEASGVNPDLLANDSQSQSGRAILLKQRQGLQMIQEILDNFSITKKIAGKFILSQLSEIFTLQSAKRLLGNSFIYDNFNVPVNIVLDRALAKVEEGKDNNVTELEREVLLTYPQVSRGQPITDDTGQLVTMIDTDTADMVISRILNDKELSKYDIAIGEGPYQETIKLANFMDIKELAQQGVPIPPNVLIELSMIPDSDKKGIMRQFEAQQAAQAQPMPQKASE